jgi:imidazole glycerol phosphate synthase subunit HisF
VLSKRLIACLDVRDGKLAKSVRWLRTPEDWSC